MLKRGQLIPGKGWYRVVVPVIADNSDPPTSSQWSCPLPLASAMCMNFPPKLEPRNNLYLNQNIPQNDQYDICMAISNRFVVNCLHSIFPCGQSESSAWLFVYFGVLRHNNMDNYYIRTLVLYYVCHVTYEWFKLILCIRATCRNYGPKEN